MSEFIKGVMIHMTSQPCSPIDAVITWVDGADPAHQAKRHARLKQARRALHANGINPHRWGSSDELTYCLTSLANHAPWIRHIWLVTDNQAPDMSVIPLGIRDRLRIIDHRIVFDGLHHVLPTFNSLSIETVIWRIPGLSDSFLYFNDDVFLTAPLRPEDVFCNDKPVLRGKWVDHSALAQDAAKLRDPALFNHFTQINAARLAGFDAAHMWASAHVVHPLRRPVLEDLFARLPAEFMANLAHPFRDVTQFQPMALHNHVAINRGKYVTAPAKDYLHQRSGAALELPLEQVRAWLQHSCSGDAKFLCVNDFPQLEACMPESRALIARAVGAQAGSTPPTGPQATAPERAPSASAPDHLFQIGAS